MATRSLTEVYILMRNNALQSRNIFSDQSSIQAISDNSESFKLFERGGKRKKKEKNDKKDFSDDRMALVSGVNIDLESGSVNTRSSRLPPEWVDGVEEVQYELTRIKQKMKELALLHDKHLTRPAFDESIDEEHAIEIQTQEITQMFSHCQRLIQQITAKSRKGTDMELHLSKNIVMSLIRSVQELSNNFRKSQSTYLRKMQSREERSQFFDTNIGPDTGLLDDTYMDSSGMYEQGFTAGQIQLVDDNAQEVQHRAKEIAHIVRSITDLNDIFKDMSNMIVDQGTILDRIDYNIEHASVQVEKGLEQLNKAEKYQKKNRKMYIIFILALLIIIMIIILMATKS